MLIPGSSRRRSRPPSTGGATLLFGVPTMYHRLAESPCAGRPGRLRLAVSGSAPLPAELHAAIRAGSGQVVLERYGMTETVMLVSNPYDGERRPGTVGFPLPGVCGCGWHRRAERSARAEIQVRGPNVIAGLPGQPGRHRGGVHIGRLVPHRRPRHRSTTTAT